MVDIEGTSKVIVFDEEEPIVEGGETMIEYEKPADMSLVSEVPFAESGRVMTEK